MTSNFKYAICMDFNATCWEKNVCLNRFYSNGEIKNFQEIIEFPAVLHNLQTGEIEAEFHEFVRPTEIPILSKYCTTVTGINQMDVNMADSLRVVLMQFDKWIKMLAVEKDLVLFNRRGRRQNTVIITWTNYDLGTYLKRECERKRIRRQKYFNRWIDIRVPFADWSQCFRELSFKEALKRAAVSCITDNQQHAGMEATRNLAHLISVLVKDNVELAITAYFKNGY